MPFQDNKRLHDYNQDGHLDIDLNHWEGKSWTGEDGSVIHGTDTDNDGVIDWFDINMDGDINDWVSIDEDLSLYYTPAGDAICLTDDNMEILLEGISANKIIIAMESCHSGGFIDDLSSSNRIIITGCGEEEEAINFGKEFANGLCGKSQDGITINTDFNNDGRISILEAFNYTSIIHTPLNEVKMLLDDDGDKSGHKIPFSQYLSTQESDGTLADETFLENPNFLT